MENIIYPSEGSGIETGMPWKLEQTDSVRWRGRFLYSLELSQPFSIFNVVMEKAQIKLGGRELNARRPSVGTAFLIGDRKLVMSPEVTASPTGWKLGDGIKIAIQGLPAKHSLIYREGTVWGKSRLVFAEPEKFYFHYKQTIDPLYELLTNTGAILAASKMCLYCNKTLTDPESISVGIGSQCRRDHAESVRRLQDLIEKLTGTKSIPENQAGELLDILKN